MASIPPLGASDCEALRDGFLAQPANAVSSLAFTAIGVAAYVWALAANGFERRYRLVLGAVMAIAGIGSFLYHGPQRPFAVEGHDWSLLVLISLVGSTLALARLEMREMTRWMVIAASSIASVGIAEVMGTTNGAFVVWLVVIVVADASLHRGTPRNRALYGWIVAVAGLALVSFLFGRTGSPLCRPASVFQFHALWHVLAATAVGLHAVASEPIRARITSP